MAHTAPTEGLRLLSLDGGGIRGLSSLYILDCLLREVMVKEKRDTMPLPCEYFDLIGGTSTGGIIALMLGRLRMSVDDAISKYGKLSKEVFSQRKWLGNGKFKARNLEEAIKEVIGEQEASGRDAEARMRDNGKPVCKTFVCVSDPNVMNNTSSTLIRTYEPQSGPRGIDCKIWEAARATSAALSFFKPISIDDDHGLSNVYADGGTDANNPAKLVLNEAKAVFEGRNLACLISIGTGKPQILSLNPPNFFYRHFARLDVAQLVVQMITDCEKTAEELRQRFDGHPDVYFRLNCDRGMEKVNLGDWEKSHAVKSFTIQYLQLQETKEVIERAAEAGKRRGPILIRDASGIIPKSQRIARSERCPHPTPVFTGRGDTLDVMDQFFSGPSKQKRVFTLYGLGGIGKSQISRKFVELAQKNVPKRFSDIFYVDASSVESLKYGFEAIAVEKNNENCPADTMRWLDHERDWLLILDGADNPDINLFHWIPSNPHGNTIITSRNGQTGVHSFPLEYGDRRIDIMKPDEAVILFFLRAGLSKADDTLDVIKNHPQYKVAQTIVKELGYLALAITQASGYIASVQEDDLEEYLRRYRQEHRLLEEYEYVRQRLDDYTRTVYTTWNMNFEDLQARNPGAATFLRICAFLNHESIPKSIFRNAARQLLSSNGTLHSSEMVLSWSKDFLSKFTTPDGFNRMKMDILCSSLMDMSLQRDVSMHILVKDWVRRYPNSPVSHRHAGFILSLSIHFSYYDRGTDLRQLLPHTQEIRHQDGDLELHSTKWFGRAYSEQMQYEDAESLTVDEISVKEKWLGTDHPSTLEAYAHLALIRGAQCRMGDAKKWQDRVMGTMRHGLDKESPLMHTHNGELRDILTSMTRLTQVYIRNGFLREAQELQAEVTKASTRAFGESHPYTLKIMDDIAEIERPREGGRRPEVGPRVRVMSTKQGKFGEDQAPVVTALKSLGEDSVLTRGLAKRPGGVSSS